MNKENKKKTDKVQDSKKSKEEEFNRTTMSEIVHPSRRVAGTARRVAGTAKGDVRISNNFDEPVCEGKTNIGEDVFADVGLADAEQQLINAKLTIEIYRLLKDRGLRQTEVANLLGTRQTISTFLHCRPVSLSLGCLLEFLTILGQDIELTVKPATKHGKEQRGRMSVKVETA